MEETAFELLGIENKELPVSNLLSYYFDTVRNKEYGIQFLNDFCALANIAGVTKNEKVEVTREYYFQDSNKNNYIDILIRIGDDKNHPDRIICIENKINAEEGCKQTKKYYDYLEKTYPECSDRQYIYLTKQTSYVNLSSLHFIHIRYNELGELLVKKEYENMPLAKDFYNFYVLREMLLYQEIEEQDKRYEANQKEVFERLIDYIVWKFNVNSDPTMFDSVFCLKGKSAQSASSFLKISLQGWQREFKHNKVCHPIDFHLEAYGSDVAFHMELHPYEPFSKLASKYGESFKSEYESVRNQLRMKIEQWDWENEQQSIQKINVKKNAVLSIGKFHLKASTYKEYYSQLIKLISSADAFISGIEQVLTKEVS